MASPIVVQRALQAFANNYNKTDRWIEDTHKLWARGLADMHDQDLVRGVEEWCRNRSRLPNLARLRELIEANPKTMTPAQLDGCPACNSTGWREVCRWYDSKGKVLTENVVAACDCSKGRRISTGPVEEWSALVDRWNADPFTEAVHYSTAQEPHLRTDQRCTPEQLKEWKERLKPRDTVPGWSRISDRKQ